MAAEWNFGRVGSCCAATGKPFAEGEKIIAAIYETTGEEIFVRRDFSLDAFRATQGRLRLEEAGQEQEPYSHWQTAIRPKDSKKPIFVDSAVLVDFFERLENETELRRLQFRYVLALILMRKRILRYESAQVGPDGIERWTMTLVHPVERCGDGPLKRPCTLLRPEIDETQLGQISEQLSSILAGDGLE